MNFQNRNVALKNYTGISEEVDTGSTEIIQAQLPEYLKAWAVYMLPNGTNEHVNNNYKKLS